MLSTNTETRKFVEPWVMTNVLERTVIGGGRVVNRVAHRVGLQLNIDKIAYHDSADCHQDLQNPSIRIDIYDSNRTLEVPEAQALGVTADEMRLRLAAGDFCIVSFDGERVVGYDWYARGPFPFNKTPYLIDFGLDRAHSYHSFTMPEYRGRGLAPDRWRFAHRGLPERGMKGSAFTVALGNLSSRRASNKMDGVQWIGYLVYGQWNDRHFHWLSRGCRAAGVSMR